MSPTEFRKYCLVCVLNSENIVWSVVILQKDTTQTRHFTVNSDFSWMGRSSRDSDILCIVHTSTLDFGNAFTNAHSLPQGLLDKDGQSAPRASDHYQSHTHTLHIHTDEASCPRTQDEPLSILLKANLLIYKMCIRPLWRFINLSFLPESHLIVSFIYVWVMLCNNAACFHLNTAGA